MDAADIVVLLKRLPADQRQPAKVRIDAAIALGWDDFGIDGVDGMPDDECFLAGRAPNGQRRLLPETE